MDQHVAILGAGSWGTALSVLLARAGHPVTLWARRAEAAATIRHTRHNPTYLPDVEIPTSVRVTSDLSEAATDANCWAFAMPSQAVRGVAKTLRSYMRSGLLVVSLAKGIENRSLETMTQVLGEVLTTVPRERIGVLYGPSHAEEVAAEMPTAVVAAAPTHDVAEQIQSVFMTDRFRVYANTDVVGVEVAGSVKNVLALAAGMSDGIGYGDNAKAALLTRGIAEIRRLGMVMGARAETFSGLAGIGDWRDNGAGAPRLPHVRNLAFSGVEGEALTAALADRVACSTGSACTSASVEPSAVLRAMGQDHARAAEAVRLSWGRFTTTGEMDAAVAAIADAVTRLRSGARRAAG